MAKPSRLAPAVSFAALATVLTGCATSTDKVNSASYREGKPQGDVGLATRAAAALNANDVAGAIALAERAVTKTPDDAGFRGLLGNAYFAAGRFASAETAYKDALAIYSSQPKVILKLALVEIAQGKSAQAAALLNASREDLDTADYGLALALAGEPSDAVAALETAARAQDADARVRQNLALAYALTGDWAKARTVAAQDVPANQLDARIQQWMQLAKPTHAADQVAALTGVTPAALDPGQPVRLALTKGDAVFAAADHADAPSEVVAQAAPTPQPIAAAPAPQFAQAAPETVAPARPPADPVRVAAAPEPVVPVAAAAPAPVAPVAVAAAAVVAPEAPAAFALMTAKFAPAPKAAKARRAPAPIRPAALRLAGKGPVMQLGAYKSPQYVNAAWGQLTKKYPALRAYLPLRARFDSPKGTFYRLSVQGFATEREALTRCQLLKSRGGTCFVRGFAGDAPVELASR